MSQTEALLRALLNIFPSNLRHEMVHLSTFVSYSGSWNYATKGPCLGYQGKHCCEQRWHSLHLTKSLCIWYATRQLKSATLTYYLCCFIFSSIKKPFPSFTFSRNSVTGAGHHLCRHDNKGDSTHWFDHCTARWEDWQSQHLSPEWYLHRGSSGEVQSWQDCQVSNCPPCSLKLQGLEIPSFSDRFFTAMR